MTEYVPCPHPDCLSSDKYEITNGGAIHWGKMHDGDVPFIFSAEKDAHCINCEKYFWYDPQYKCGRYCSEDCSQEYNSGENSYWYGKRGEETNMGGRTGEDHPMYGYEHTEEYKEMMSERMKGAKEGKDNPMYGKFGELNPNWQGGKHKQFSKAFHRNRPKVIQRDDEKCRVCDMGRERHYEKRGRDLTVHHITPRDYFVDEPGERPPDEAGAMDNLVTVCAYCHQSVESGNATIDNE